MANYNNKRRITRLRACPTKKRRAGLLITGQNIGYDPERIKRAMSYNEDLTNEFVVGTPERRTQICREARNSSIRKSAKKTRLRGKRVIARKRKQENKNPDEEYIEKQQEIQTMFGEYEDFELMKEEVPKEREVMKQPKRRRLQSPTHSPTKLLGSPTIFIDPRAKLPVEEEIVNDSIQEDSKSQNEFVQTSSPSAGIGTIQEQSILPTLDESKEGTQHSPEEENEEVVDDSIPVPGDSGPLPAAVVQISSFGSSPISLTLERTTEDAQGEVINASIQGTSKIYEEQQQELDEVTQKHSFTLTTAEGGSQEQSKSNCSDQDALIVSVVLIDPRAKLPVEEEIVSDSIQEDPKSQNEFVQTSSASTGTIQEQSKSYCPDRDALIVSSASAGIGTIQEESKSNYSDQGALNVILIDPRVKLPVEEEIVSDSIQEDPKSQNEDVQTSSASAGINTVQEQSKSNYSDQDALNVVLDLCDNKNVISWYDFVSSACSLEKCTKLGEGTYGEVYKMVLNGKEIALKVIPFAVDQEQRNKIVNGDYLKPPTSTFNELLITRELSKLSIETLTALNGFVTPGFITLTQAAIVKGVYPEELLLAWDQFKELKPNLAENQRPSEYATEDQHFILFALANGGIDLESYKVRNQKECYSIFYQIAISLAIAEEALEFEHRDLHIGNILIDTCGEHEIIRFIHEGESIDVHSCGVKASIIDFTNSRMQKGDLTVYIDLSEDEGLFQGEGDYQFEIYRMMRCLNKNEWKGFTPKTNLLWLHYLSRKLFDIPRLFRKRRAPLLEMFDKLLQKERVKEFLADEEFTEEFADYRV